MTFKFCSGCNTNIEERAMEVSEGVTGFLHFCPICDSFLFERPYTEEELSESVVDIPKKEVALMTNYALTPDEIRYTIHSLSKQEAKLQGALKQVYNTITKLQIMLEIVLEESK